MQSGSLSPILERHTPQHPLPEEIAKMGEGGTVCQFCGVSYLIHREIKKLEDRIEELEKAIDEGRIAKRNEALLKEELQKSAEEYKIIVGKFHQKELEMREAERDLKNLSQNLKAMTRQKDEHEKRITDIKTIHQNFVNQIRKNMDTLLRHVSEAKRDLVTVKQAIEPFKKEFFNTTDIIGDNILSAISNFNSESEASDKVIEGLQEELMSKIKNEELLQASIKVMKNEIDNVRKENEKIIDRNETERKNFQKQLTDFKLKTSELRQELIALQSQLGISKSDSAQINEALGTKKQELQSTLQKFHKLEKESEVTIRRLNQEMKILEGDIKAIQTENLNWKEREKALLLQQDRLQSLVNSTCGESRQMNEHMAKLREELEMLKGERGQMIMSHQSQISQLKETFKEKLNKANGDPDALEETIRILKQSHKREMIELESHMKERHDIELALEKERHEEELKSYIDRYKKMAESDSSEWRRRAEELANDITISQNHIVSLKSEYSRYIEDNDKEKADLKHIISELEKKIMLLTGEHENGAINLKVELKEVKRRLADALEDKVRFEDRVTSLTKEIAVLQETVRRECEERFELTEALSQAHDQIKKEGSTGSTPIRTPVSAINGSSRQNSFSSQEIHSVHLSNGLKSSVSLDSLIGQKSESSPHVKDIKFKGAVRSSVARNLPDGKSDELADLARRRIAAALNRK